MRRKILAAIVILAVACVLAGCTGSENDTVVISERFFVNEMKEVVFNPNQYLGRTLQFEGMFRIVPVGDINRFIVMRYTIGCCGEEPIGLEVIMGNFTPFEHNAWVEVAGTLDLNDGFLVLHVTSITELDERGAELVSG